MLTLEERKEERIQHVYVHAVYMMEEIFMFAGHSILKSIRIPIQMENEYTIEK